MLLKRVSFRQVPVVERPLQPWQRDATPVHPATCGHNRHPAAQNDLNIAVQEVIHWSQLRLDFAIAPWHPIFAAEEWWLCEKWTGHSKLMINKTHPHQQLVDDFRLVISRQPIAVNQQPL